MSAAAPTEALSAAVPSRGRIGKAGGRLSDWGFYDAPGYGTTIGAGGNIAPDTAPGDLPKPAVPPPVPPRHLKVWLTEEQHVAGCRYDYVLPDDSGCREASLPHVYAAYVPMLPPNSEATAYRDLGSMRKLHGSDGTLHRPDYASAAKDDSRSFGCPVVSRFGHICGRRRGPYGLCESHTCRGLGCSARKRSDALYCATCSTIMDRANGALALSVGPASAGSRGVEDPSLLLG